MIPLNCFHRVLFLLRLLALQLKPVCFFFQIAFTVLNNFRHNVIIKVTY